MIWHLFMESVMLKSFAEEFKAFIMRGNVVDLAIGVVIGAAFGAIVEAIVKGVFTPIIGLMIGGFDFSAQSIGYKDAQIRYGFVIQTIITFLITGFCLFLVVKAMNKMKLSTPAAPAEPTPSEKLLAEIRDLLKKQ
jgi:large conductance mechanosensitive channel